MMVSIVNAPMVPAEPRMALKTTFQFSSANAKACIHGSVDSTLEVTTSANPPEHHHTRARSYASTLYAPGTRSIAAALPQSGAFPCRGPEPPDGAENSCPRAGPVARCVQQRERCP